MPNEKSTMHRTASFLKLASIASIVFFTPSMSIAEQWDGRYTASIGFQMGSMTVCPLVLPITIEIEIKNSEISGVILNDGGGNKDKFCTLYHNGTISGTIDESGEFKKVRIKQSDSHSRQYSSYAIRGNINSGLTLISRESQFHPNAKFSLKKRKK